MVELNDLEMKILSRIHTLSGGNVDRIINRKDVAKLMGLSTKEAERVLASLTKKRLIRYILFGSLCITDVGIARMADTKAEFTQTIFISYRRADSLDVTARIYDRLVATFGSDAVYKDVDSIPYGADLRSHLFAAVTKADIFLPVIGLHWLSAIDDASNVRLDDPQDFVRLEVAVALRHELYVIPLLVAGAAMPAENDLPEDIKLLASRQALRIRPDPDFHNDVNHLIGSIQECGGAADSSRSGRRLTLRSSQLAAVCWPGASAPRTSEFRCQVGLRVKAPSGERKNIMPSAISLRGKDGATPSIAGGWDGHTFDPRRERAWIPRNHSAIGSSDPSGSATVSISFPRRQKGGHTFVFDSRTSGPHSR